MQRKQRKKKRSPGHCWYCTRRCTKVLFVQLCLCTSARFVWKVAAGWQRDREACLWWKRFSRNASWLLHLLRWSVTEKGTEHNEGKKTKKRGSSPPATSITGFWSALRLSFYELGYESDKEWSLWHYWPHSSSWRCQKTCHAALRLAMTCSDERALLTHRLELGQIFFFFFCLFPFSSHISASETF